MANKVTRPRYKVHFIIRLKISSSFSLDIDIGTMQKLKLLSKLIQPSKQLLTISSLFACNWFFAETNDFDEDAFDDDEDVEDDLEMEDVDDDREQEDWEEEEDRETNTKTKRKKKIKEPTSDSKEKKKKRIGNLSIFYCRSKNYPKTVSELTSFWS